MSSSPVQEGVQEWKSRITVTTAPDSILSKEKETSMDDDRDGCCSSNGAVCCGSNGSGSNCNDRPTTTPTTLPFSSLLCYGCIANLRDLDLKSMGSQDNDEDKSSSSFDLPPYVAEIILNRAGYESLEAFEERTSLSSSTGATTNAAADPRSSLREQIKEFLIASDDEDEEDQGDG